MAGPVKRTAKGKGGAARGGAPRRRSGSASRGGPVRRQVRRKPRKRQQAPAAGRNLLRAVAVLALVTLVVFAVPPLRRGLSAAALVLTEAMAESRRVELRRLATARFALEYGVSLQLASDIERAAMAEGIDPELAFRLVYVESRFKERAVSSAGALGLTQLMPATAESLQPGITRDQIFERHTNLRLGLRYLRWLMEIYDGDVEEALHAYNRGPGTVARLRAQGKDPDNGYADLILHGRDTPSYTGNGLSR